MARDSRTKKNDTKKDNTKKRKSTETKKKGMAAPAVRQQFRLQDRFLMLITPANSNLYDIPCCQFSEKEVYYIQFRKHTHYRRIAA